MSDLIIPGSELEEKTTLVQEKVCKLLNAAKVPPAKWQEVSGLQLTQRFVSIKYIVLAHALFKTPYDVIFHDSFKQKERTALTETEIFGDDLKIRIWELDEKLTNQKITFAKKAIVDQLAPMLPFDKNKKALENRQSLYQIMAEDYTDRQIQREKPFKINVLATSFCHIVKALHDVPEYVVSLNKGLNDNIGDVSLGRNVAFEITLEPLGIAFHVPSSGAVIHTALVESLKTLCPSYTSAIEEITNDLRNLRLGKLDAIHPSALSNKNSYTETQEALIASVAPVLSDAMRREPPCNQFSCSLAARGGAEQNYRIGIMMRNKEGKEVKFSADTLTTSLEEAIDRKIFLQSYILRQDNIISLYSRSQGNGKAIMEREAILPADAPQAMHLEEISGYYKAIVKFQADDFVIPLGIRCAGDDGQATQKAKERLEMLKTQLEEWREGALCPSVGEATQKLKSATAGLGWRVADTMVLEHYGEGNVDLGFPAVEGQSTLLKSANFHLEGASAENPNAYWQLNFIVKISGLKEDPLEYRSSLNLHTDDDLVAQVRGREAMEFLHNSLQSLAIVNFLPENERVKTLRWQIAEEGSEPDKLILQFSNKATPDAPAPQNLQHMLDDLPNPKANFQVNYESFPAEENKVKLVLTVQRGTEDDRIDFKHSDGSFMRRSFLVDPEDIQAIQASIDENFTRLLQDHYNSRTPDNIRKTPKDFRVASIKNFFKWAVDNAARHNEMTDTEPVAHVRKIIDKGKKQTEFSPSRGISPSYGETVRKRRKKETFLYLLVHNGPPEFLKQWTGISQEEAEQKNIIKVGVSHDAEGRVNNLNKGTPPMALYRLKIHKQSDMPFPDQESALQAEAWIKDALHEIRFFDNDIARSGGEEYFLGRLDVVTGIFYEALRFYGMEVSADKMPGKTR